MGPASSEPDGTRHLRHELLARLVPAFVHGANNALAALRGGIELRSAGLAGTGDAFLLEQVVRLDVALSSLSRFARDADDESQSFELSDALQRARTLVEPLVAELGVAFEVRPMPRAVVRGPEDRLVQLVVLELGLRVLRRPRRLRLSLRADGPTCVLRLAAVGSPAPADAALEAAGEELARVSRGTRRVRRGAGYEVVQLTLAASAVTPPAAPPVRRTRVVLLAPRGEATELCELVLAQAGYEVRVREVPGGGPADVFVLDDELPGAAGLAAGLRDRGEPVLELTSGIPRPPAAAALAKPFGADELLQAVAALASAPR